MIVVVGAPALDPGPPAGPGGPAVGICRAALAAGARVELVGRVGDDDAGDRVVVGLGVAGIGHVAVLRDGGATTPLLAPPPEEDDPGAEPDAPPPSREPHGTILRAEDVELGLRYLTSFEVLVAVGAAADPALGACVAAAEFASARLVVVLRADAPVPPGIPPSAVVLAAPPGDGAAFTTLVGRFAASLDRGEEPAAALAAAAAGWERPAPGS